MNQRRFKMGSLMLTALSTAVAGHRGYFWAPDIIHHEGRYWLYYSVSKFGVNTSAIALASNPTLDPADPEYRWSGHGIVIQSGKSDNFNAIDPAVTKTPDGKLGFPKSEYVGRFSSQKTGEPKFAGDGGARTMVARARDGKWICAKIVLVSSA